MIHSLSLRNLAIAALCLLITPLALAGVYVEQTVSSSGGDMNMLAKAWTEGDKARVEFSESDNQLMPSGSYLITHDGGVTTYLVNPEKQTYSLWDLDAIFSTFSQTISDMEGIVDVSFEDVENETLPTEPGGELLGYDTTISSWRSAFTMQIKVMMMKQNQRTESFTRAWVTKEVSNPTLNFWLTVRPPSTGNEEVDQMLSSGMGQIDGTPLKLVQESTVTDKKGRGSNQTMTMEVTELREMDVDSEKFVMPEGYTEISLMDSAASSESKKEKENPLKALGGMFKRKKKDKN